MRFPSRLAVLIVACTALLPATAQADADPAPPAFAGLPPIVFQSYDVHGTTQDAIALSLRASAMYEPGHPTATGRTQWKANFAWETQRMPGRCRTRSPRTDMQVTVILPRLVDADRASPATLAAWRRYIATIERHEAGHARIAFAHALDFTHEAQGAACFEIKDIGQRIVDRISALQQDYDRRTRNGEAQGDIVE